MTSLPILSQVKHQKRGNNYSDKYTKIFKQLQTGFASKNSNFKNNHSFNTAQNDSNVMQHGTDMDSKKNILNSASGSIERGLGSGNFSSSKLLNYRQIKLYKVLDNKFVGRSQINLRKFDQNKGSEQFFNFTGDNNNDVTSQQDQQRMEHRSYSVTDLQKVNNHITDFVSLEGHLATKHNKFDSINRNFTKNQSTLSSKQLPQPSQAYTESRSNQPQFSYHQSTMLSRQIPRAHQQSSSTQPQTYQHRSNKTPLYPMNLYSKPNSIQQQQSQMYSAKNNIVDQIELNTGKGTVSQGEKVIASNSDQSNLFQHSNNFSTKEQRNINVWSNSMDHSKQHVQALPKLGIKNKEIISSLFVKSSPSEKQQAVQGKYIRSYNDNKEIKIVQHGSDSHDSLLKAIQTHQTIESSQENAIESLNKAYENAKNQGQIRVNISSRQKDNRLNQDKEVFNTYKQDLSLVSQFNESNNFYGDTLNIQEILQANKPITDSILQNDRSIIHNSTPGKFNSSQHSIDSFSNEKIKGTMLSNYNSGDKQVTNMTRNLTTQTPKTSVNSRGKQLKNMHNVQSIVSTQQSRVENLQIINEDTEIYGGNIYSAHQETEMDMMSSHLGTAARRAITTENKYISSETDASVNRSAGMYRQNLFKRAQHSLVKMKNLSKSSKMFQRQNLNLIKLIPEVENPFNVDTFLNHRVEKSYQEQFKCFDKVKEASLDKPDQTIKHQLKPTRKFPSQTSIKIQNNDEFQKGNFDKQNQTNIEMYQTEQGFNDYHGQSDSLLQQPTAAGIRTADQTHTIFNTENQISQSSFGRDIGRLIQSRSKTVASVEDPNTSEQFHETKLASSDLFDQPPEIIVQSYDLEEGPVVYKEGMDSVSESVRKQFFDDNDFKKANYSHMSGEYMIPGQVDMIGRQFNFGSQVHQTPSKPYQFKNSVFSSESPEKSSISKLTPSAPKIFKHQMGQAQNKQAKLIFVPHSKTLKNYQVFKVMEGVVSQSQFKPIQIELANQKNQAKVIQSLRQNNQMTEKQFIMRYLNKSSEAAGRRIVKHIFEKDTSNRKKQLVHSVQDGKRTHLEEFKKQLHKRKDQVKEIIDEEYNKFENIIEVEKEIEIMDQKQKQKQDQKKLDQFEKLKKLKDKVSYQAQSHLDKLKGMSQKQLLNDSQMNSAIGDAQYQLKNYNQDSVSEQSSSDCESHIKQNQTIEQRLAKINTIDELDFQYRENIQGCKQCQSTLGSRDQVGFKRDKNMYKHVIKYRKVFQKEKVTVDELSDDLESMQVHRKTDKDKQRMLELVNPEKVKFEKLNKKLQEDQELLNKFLEWQEKMWISFKQYIKEKEVNDRPDYFQKYDQAKELHLNPFQITFKLRVNDEVNIKESLWKDSKQLIKLRQHLRYILNMDNIKKDDFIQNLILVKDEVDRQNVFFDQIRDLLFISENKTIFDQIHDQDIQLELDSEDRYEKCVIDEMVTKRNREQFLQKDVSQMHMRRNLEQTENPQIEYAKNCYHNNSLSLPHMVNPPLLMEGKFVIIGKSIDSGQAQSLGEAMPAIQYKYNQLYFSGNNMDGNSFAKILSGLAETQRSQIKSIVYSGQNEFNKTSCDVLRLSYLDKKGLDSLTELKLVNLKVRDQNLITQILQDILIETRLKHLTISKVGGLESRSVDVLCNIFAEKKQSLQFVDISWNKINTRNMVKLMQAIRSNFNIRYLNIAFNPFDKADPLLELGNFIRQNPNLQHIDLSGTLQTLEQVRRVVKKAKKSLSLLVIHLSHIHCISQNYEIQSYILKKMNNLNFVNSVHHQNISSFSPTKPPPPFSILDKIPGHEIPLQMSQSLYQSDVASIDLEDDQKMSHRYKYELINQQKIQQRDSIYFSGQQEEMPYSSNKKSNFVLQRTIGHIEIPGNNTWMAREVCYSCERWKFTLIFLDSAGLKKSDEYILEGSMDLLNSHSKKHQFIDVREYVRLITESSGDEATDFARFLELMPHDKKETVLADKHQLENLKRQFKKKDPRIYQIGNMWYHILENKLLQKKYQCLSNNPTFDIHRHYKIMAKNYVDGDPQLMVFADYMRPSKRIDYYKVINKIQDKVIHEEQFVPMCRHEDLPRFKLGQFSKVKKEIPFHRENSVFRDWYPDNKRILDTSIQRDLERWKCPRFIKDEEDLQDVVQTVKSRFAQIKQIHHILISGDSYPHIGLMEFTKFAVQTEILDETIEQQTIDRMIIASKVGSPPGVASSQMFRYEYLELLVRVADVKYRQSGRATNYNQALKMLLDNIFKKYKMHPWQEFRDQHLWKHPPNNVLQANIHFLKQIYQNLFPKFVEGLTGFRNTIDLVSRSSDLKMSDKLAKFCFGMSKMTIKDEVPQHTEYNKLKFVEFLEFIGRIAYHKFIDETDVELCEKIERVLDSIFAIYNFKRVEVEGMIDNDETSDESVFVDESEVQERAKEFEYNTFIYQ